MNDQPKPPEERRLELLADRAFSGLTESEQAELSSGGPMSAQEEKWELAAAAGVVAMMQSDCEAMPSELRDRIAASAPAHLPATHQTTAPAATDPHKRRFRWAAVVAGAGWLAAAVLLIALLTQWYRPREGTSADPVAARGRLLREANDVRTVAWSAGGPQEPAITGDVVWSDARQEGYMRFRGLPANDPKRFQYQLWIFDALRDERFPVDGGVFDVPQTTPDGDIIVPIRAQLPVGRPVLFALTRERPGGVVVSDRKEIACVAKAG